MPTTTKAASPDAKVGNQDEQPTNLVPLDSPAGYLFIANSGGVLRIHMEDGKEERVLIPQNDWREWEPSFSSTNNLLAFWICTESTSELWLTSLNEWSPKRLLKFSTRECNTVSLEWLNNDQYLLLRLGNIEESIVGKSVTVANTFLLRLDDEQVVSPEGWIGDCRILAYSPSTERLATWCSDERKEEYIVVETDGTLWFTEQQPVGILKEIKFDGDTPWAWSSNQALVAFTLFDLEKGIEYLYYTTNNDNKSTTFVDNDSNLYSFLTWSPNNQFLSFLGKCLDGQFCRVVVELASQQVVWNSQMSNIDIVQDLAWSPDSQCIAVATTTKIIIVNVMTHKIVWQLQDVPVTNMAWSN